MRIDVLGAVAVSNGDASVSGRGLGGRRARVALVALALSGGHVSAQRLAELLWPDDDVPSTWQVALRGVIRGLRTACTGVGGDGQGLIVTQPAGYSLATGVDVDIELAGAALRSASALIKEGRHQAALAIAQPVAQMSGSQLLPGEDADWLDPHRRAVDELALRAVDLVVTAAGAIGDHDAAIAAARRAVAGDALNERAHRALIVALDASGDRAGVVEAFEQCRSLLADQLGVDPSQDTVRAYLAALGEQGGQSHARLPVISSTFVGREKELLELDGLLRVPGLVTVTGLGGVGKSRLVLAAAAKRADFVGGRHWISLAPVAQDALVAATVAIQLGVAVGTSDASSKLCEHLAPLGRTLLVLDGCEVVVDGVASLAVELLASCPNLTLVVTSRMPVSVDREQLLAVRPFSTPSAEESRAFRSTPQVRILLDRIRDGGGYLAIDDEMAPHVARLLQRCGGLPLALELVAAQLTALPVGDLLDHLANGLTDGGLRSIAQGSYDLLDDDEATVFRRLAVLDGPAGLPLVRDVVSGGSIAPVRVVRILRELTARGLVTVDHSGPRWRYQQDDDLHRFARELLRTTGEESATYARLADAVQALLPDDARSSPLPYQDSVSAMLGALRSLFAAALDGRSDTERCLELAFRLHRYFAANNVAEGRFWLSRLLAGSPVGRWTPYATYALGYLSYWSGDTNEAVSELTAAIDMFTGEPNAYVARALIYLAGLLDDLDRSEEAVEYVRRAIDAAAPFDVDLQVSAAMGMGSVLAERGDPAAADYARAAIEMCRGGGSPEQLALAMPTAAMVCWQVGRYELARRYVEEATPWHAGARRIARVVLLSAAAGLALTDGDLDRSVDLGIQADSDATELGIERELPLIRAVLARTLLERADIAGSARHALSALDAAEVMPFRFPLAICFETAALIGAAMGAEAGLLGALLAAAQVIRAHGNRKALPPLAIAIEQLRAKLGPSFASVAPDVTQAASLARELLVRASSGA